MGENDLFHSAEHEPKGARRRKEAAALAICTGCAVPEVCRMLAIEPEKLCGE